MSFFEDASLVLIPSGYKDQKVYSVKPTDGTGDLTFSRASSATRVQSDGLIEKVRTNLSLYSEQFDNAWWTASNITITANNTTDPFGGSAAEKALCAAGTISPNIFSSSVACTIGVEYTASYYAKQGTSKYAKIRFGGTAFATSTNSPIFDLNAGTLVSGTGVITNVGNGWYRISATQAAEVTDTGVFTVDVPDSTGVWPNGTFAGTEFIYIFGYQFEVNVSVSPYIATTTAAVSVGPVSGLPRLDYLGSTCPRLLLEPQRSNLAQYSENFDNAYWSKTAGTTITANTTISPDGYQNADTIAFAGSGNSINRFITTGLSVVSGTTYTFSVFTKSTTQVVSFGGATGGTGTNVYNGAVDYGNGWYRQSVTRTWSASGTVSVQLVLSLGAAGSTILYGFQAELGAYATSYIPTLGAAITRVADGCNKTSATAIIGQTEGTLFAEVDFTDTNADQMYLTLSDGTTNNRMHIGYDNGANRLYFNIRVSGVQQALIVQNTPANGIKKIAAAYKANDVVLYINGVQIGSSASTSVATTSRIDVGNYFTTGFEYPVKQALLFTTRLTNDQLAELTA
jgi:hypothetical protein